MLAAKHKSVGSTTNKLFSEEEFGKDYNQADQLYVIRRTHGLVVSNC